MRTFLLNCLLIVALLLGVASAQRLLATTATTIVGDGTPASCTAAALAAAVAAGGEVAFACGAAPVTITTGQLTTAAGQNVTIDGGHLITLSGGDANRHFQVQTGATLTLRHLVLADGNAGSDYGGAVYVHTGGTLNLEQSTIRDSTANGYAGGAIIDFQGTVTLTDSVIEGNQSSYGALNSTGTLTLIRTTVRNNVATVGGGGLSVGGTVSIQESLIEGNQAALGGAMYVTEAAEVTITGSHFLLNVADAPVDIEAQGGAIISYGDLRISGSTFEANRAEGYGGAIAAGPGSNDAFTYIADSTFVANEVGERGGAIDNGRGRLEVVNSTFSANRAGAGGAIQNFLGPANLYYVTFANNDGGLGGVLDQHAFDDIVDDSRQRFNLYRTALAGLSSCAITITGAPDPQPHFVSGGYNLAEDNTCAFFMNETGDVNNTPAQLGALANNGGETWTHLPAAGSPLIDAALCLPDFAMDQRGVSRPQGAQCDIGAVEVQLTPPTSTHTPTPTSTSLSTATATPSPTATATPSSTATATPSPTATSTPSPIATSTPSPTATATATTAPPSPTPTASPTLAPLPAEVVPAQPANAQPPTVQIEPVSAAPGMTITVSGVNATGSTAVRLQWQFGGAMFFAANEATEPGGAFATQLAVPDEGIVGRGKICATALDVTPAAFACADFTIDVPAAGAIDGQIAPEALSPAARAGSPDALNLAINVKLLNQAGTAVAVAPVTNAGKFLMNNILPGTYQLAVVGDLAKPVELTNVTIVSGGIIRPTLLPYVRLRTLDPVDGSECNNDDAATAAISAKYAFNGQVDWGAARALDINAPLVANQLLLNNLHRFRIQQTFGIYLNGVRVDNEFTAEAQSLSANPIVAMNFRIVANGITLLNVNQQSPFVATFNMGKLPAGRHKIYVAPVVQRGTGPVRQCPMEKEILVSNSPVNLANVANRQGNEVSSYGFDPATGQYWFNVTPPPYIYSVPNQPTNYPYVGDLQSIVSAGARISGVSSLSGACTITNAYISGYIQAAGEEICRPYVDLKAGNNACIIDPLNPGKTTISIHARPICSRYLDKVRYEGDLFNFLDLVSVRLKIGLRLDAHATLTSQIKPFLTQFYTSIFADAHPNVYGSLRLSFLRVIRPHARLTANGVSWIQPQVNVGRPVKVDGCVVARVFLSLWISGIISPQHFTLTPDRTECIDIGAQQMRALTPQEAADLALDPGPRVYAAPALASAPDGRMISVVVEDTTPNAENATPAIFARFWDPATQAWGAAVQISGADRLVNDPAATFYGANGEQALVAWSQIELTPAELSAAGNDLNAILARQEIFYTRWDGAAWLPPQRLTDDVAADGLATLAGDASGATLAWTRDTDGDLATTLDSVIAVSDWNSATHAWDAATHLSAGDGTAVVTAAARAAGATPAAGMNYDVAIDRKYDARLDRSRTVVALTFDADGDFNTGADRTVRLFQRDFDAVQLNPQPLPPKEWALLNPQPLPPRIQTPSIALDLGDLNAIKLAFVQADAVDAQGGVAGIDQPGVLWSADLRRTSDGWQTLAAPLLDQGVAVRGEEPRLLSGPNGAGSLVFRRFGAESETASIGQIALSSGIIIEGGRTVYGDPVALTNSAGAQQWMPAATLNPATNALHVNSVRRSLAPGAARSASEITQETASAARMTVLADANDPVVAIALEDRADPALETALALDRIHAPVGETVQVTAHGRNLGRRTADVTVRFFRGVQGAGVQVGEIVIGGVAAGDGFSATLPLTVQMGDQPIYALVVGADNATPTNDTAIGNLAAMIAPEISSVDGEIALPNSLLVALVQPAAEDLAGFRLLRQDDPAGSFALVAEVTEPLYLDLGLELGKNYCYQAQVYDTRGNLSTPSATVCGTVTVYRTFLPSVVR